MSRIGAFFDRFSRPVKISIQVGIVLVIGIAIVTVAFVEYSAQSSFCLNCHVMEPYYESWATSTHNDVPCIECHYAPGIKAEAMGKLQAANQVVKYVTGTYGLRPWAEIEDASCMRSGCHSERKLEGEIGFGNVRFNHAQHLGEVRRGKQLRCTSCHSQIVQGDHVAVTVSTCYLCHFKDEPLGEPIAGCIGCHPSPPVVESPAGFVVDHQQYVEDLVSCVGCHDQVTAGTGEANKSRCFVCHNEPERLDQYEDTEVMHRVHIAEHNVECTQCHMPIEHRVVSLATTFELDCGSCHTGVHDAQRQMYAGIGGHAAENAPSEMYLARVSCRGCHGIPAEVKGHEEVLQAGEATCLSCHGVRYANILPSWQEELDRKVGRVESVVAGARRTAGSAPVRSRATVDSLLALAAENLDFVRVGKGAHNVVYADDLLRATVELTRQAVEVGQLPYRVGDVDLGRPARETVCLRCHLGAERQTVVFQGAEFDHEVHTLRAGLECSSCHTPLAEHGGVLLADRAACNDCHHSVVEPRNCAACHEGLGGVPTAAIATSIGDFAHGPHREAGLECAQCHRPPEMSAANLNCDGCHQPHHQPEATCLSCHRGGAIDIHRSIGHRTCTQCHGDAVSGVTAWSRQVCTVCHADRVEHNAPADCQVCHQVPPPGQ